MKKSTTVRGLFLAFFLLSKMAAFAQDTHSFQWRFESEDSAAMRCFDVLPLPDRGYVLAGLVEKPVGSAFFFPVIWRTDCQGQVLWAKVFNHATESANNTSGRVLAISPTDFVLVANVGFFFNSPYNDIFMARVDGEGNAVWAHRFGGGANGQDVAESAILTADGNIVVAGKTSSHGSDGSGGATYSDQYFMKISPAGDIVWTRTVGNPQAVDRCYDITELPDGSLAAAGSYLHNGTFHANLLKLDKDGNLLWHRVFGEKTAPQANHGYGVLHTSDGGFLITGSSTNLQANFQGYPDFLAIKTDATGAPEWSRVIAGAAPDLFENAVNATELPDGNFAIACASASYPSTGFVPNKFVVATISPTGGLVRATAYNSGSSSYPRIVADPQENGYLLTGSTNWQGYGGNGNRFDPILINLTEDLGTNDCLTKDYTNITTVANPAFDFADAPATAKTGGKVVNDLINVSDFGLFLNIVCETDGYGECPTVAAPEVFSSKNAFEIFPNPARAGQPVSLRWRADGVERVTVFDAQGRLIHTHQPVPGMQNLEIQVAGTGVFWVKMDGAHAIWTGKMVVVK